MMIKFENITNMQLVRLVQVEGIDDLFVLFVTKDAMNKIKDILKLEGCDFEKLTSIRNGVVRAFSDIIDEMLDEQKSFEEFRKMNAIMSATTAVIDNELFKMGALY